MSAEVDQAIRDGKFPPSRRQHYERLMETDPVGTRQLLGRMPAGLLPVGEVGGAGVSLGAAPDSYPSDWVGQLRDPGKPPKVMKADD